MSTKNVVGVVVGLASLAAFSATQLFAQADAARGDTANRPAERQGTTEQARHNRAFLGVGVENASAALASHLALPEGEGLVVEHVAANSPAAKAGIERHDVLLRVGGQKLLSAE
jgi:S1-C subfamily serine protease